MHRARPNLVTGCFDRINVSQIVSRVDEKKRAHSTIEVMDLKGLSAGVLALRGGFSGSGGGGCRSAARWRASKESWSSKAGFRVVLAPGP